MWKIIWPHFNPKTKNIYCNSQAFYLWFSIWALPSAYTKMDTNFSLAYSVGPIKILGSPCIWWQKKILRPAHTKSFLSDMDND
jgi:hypothetical protein